MSPPAGMPSEKTASPRQLLRRFRFRPRRHPWFRCRRLFSKPAAAAALLLPAVLAMLPALPLLAAEGESPPTAMDLVYKGINLAVLLGVIFYFARKPVARFFKGSAEAGKKNFDGARNAAEQVASELEEQKQRIAGLEAELGRMVQAAREDAEVERRQLLQEAEAHAERIKTQARQQVEQEMNKARNELRTQLADEAVKLAEETIRSRLDDKRRKELVGEYIGRIEAAS